MQCWHQHQHQQHQAGGPGLAVPVVIRRDGVRVNHHRQRRGGLIDPRGPELVVETGEQQRRGLSRHARHAQDHAGQNALAWPPARPRGWCTFHLLAPSASAPSRSEFGTVAGTARWRAGRWESSSGSARSRRPARRNGACGTTTTRPGENADHDGGHAVQQVRGVADQHRQGLAAELRQIDAAQNPDRNADQAAAPGSIRAAHDGIGHAAAGFAGRQGKLGEESSNRASASRYRPDSRGSGTEPTR
jgi:hypothetical protein